MRDRGGWPDAAATLPDVTGRTRGPMKIATFNVNGVNARLPVLLRCLEEEREAPLNKRPHNNLSHLPQILES